jgi:mycofactocin system FadH/OYE family oxidoreductase 2
MFDNLFSPLKLGKVDLPNRICFLAHRTNFGKRGLLTDRHVGYYRRRAQGGCGLIFVGELSIHPGDYPYESTIEAYRPEVVSDLARLTAAVHEYDTLVFAQLTHHGFQSSGAISRQAVWGPSALADISFGETAKPVEPEDVQELTDAFARGAELMRQAGFDGIEIDMGHESLLRQFLSTLSNYRQDEYGGSLENRMRLPLEIVDRVRKAVGEDFTVGIRLCLDEKFWGAITIDEAKQFAEKFEQTGQVDFINGSFACIYNLYLVHASKHTPPGFALDLTEQLKQVVKVPVIASHQIVSPQMASEMIEKGQGDAAGFVRPLICDPDFPQKAKEGRPDDIRYCIRDNEGCVGRVNKGRRISCTLNPRVGYEPLTAEEPYTQAQVKKKVMVVGAGPAGLEAARVARERGHEVTVYEKDDEVGGQIRLAKLGAGRQTLEEIIRYQIHMLEKLKVPVHTGVRVGAEMVLKETSDTVIVTTGATPKERPVPGEYGPPGVLNVWDVLGEKHPVGEKILFIDENGGHQATATVEFLADQGKKVDMVTSELFIGIELAPLGDLYLSRQRLLQKGATFTCDVRVDEINGNTVKARNIYTNEPIIYEGYDTVVLAMGNQVQDRLYKTLKGLVKELYRAGDCVAPRYIGMAIFEGRKVGEKP